MTPVQQSFAAPGFDEHKPTSLPRLAGGAARVWCGPCREEFKGEDTDQAVERFRRAHGVKP